MWTFKASSCEHKDGFYPLRSWFSLSNECNQQLALLRSSLTLFISQGLLHRFFMVVIRVSRLLLRTLKQVLPIDCTTQLIRLALIQPFSVSIKSSNAAIHRCFKY